jgi:hypothetical protein
MRVNVNNTETFPVKYREEAEKVAKEKLTPFMKEGDFIGWYKSDQRFDMPDIAAIYNKRHDETKYFARIINW